MKNYQKTITDLLFNFIMGCVVGLVLLLPFRYNPLYGGVAFVAFTIVAFIYCFYTGKSILPRWLLYAGLLKEIWISRLMEKFYPTAAWLDRAQDLSGSVEYNTINLAEIGADPDVLVNNTSYPVPFAERTDVPQQLPLDYYDTKGTVVRNSEVMQLAYPKMDTVVRQHGQALAKEQSKKAAWNFAPAADGAFTPVIGTDVGFDAAAQAAAASGFQYTFTFEVIIQLGQKFDDMDVPQEGRVLVLNTQHKADLLKADLKLYKALTNQAKGEMLMQYGSFDIYDSTQTPTYNGSTKAKKAYGASAAGTDAKSSFAFVDTEVMRCRGTMDMFSRLKDPEARGDIIGFQQRFLAMSLRGKYIAAIVDQKKP